MVDINDPNGGNALPLQLMAIAMQTPGVGGGPLQPLGLPVMFWGAPGVGKTARINEIANALGFYSVTVLASIRTPEDFLGVPVPYKPGSDEDPNVEAEVAPAPEPVSTEGLSPMQAALARKRRGRRGATIPVPAPSKKAAKEMVTGANLPPTAVYYAPPSWVRDLQTRTSGLSYVNKKGERVLPPDFRLGYGNRSVLFLDEFSTAEETVQAALLRVVHERIVGDEELPRNTAVIAAANPPAMSPGGTTMTAPTANRFLHAWWISPSIDQWAEWLRGDGEDSNVVIPRVDPEAFLNRYDFIAPMVASFMQSVGRTRAKGEGNHLFYMPDEATFGMLQTRDAVWFEANPHAYSWPSPRSWELAARALAAVYAATDHRARPLRGTPEHAGVFAALSNYVICAAVGSTSCNAFNAWIVDQDLEPPETYLANPGKWRLDDTKPDRNSTIVRLMWAYAEQHPDRADEVASFIERLFLKDKGLPGAFGVEMCNRIKHYPTKMKNRGRETDRRTLAAGVRIRDYMTRTFDSLTEVC
jgi:hypothetical protein